MKGLGRGPVLEHSVRGELIPWKGIPAGVVLEELHSEGQTHAGVAHVGLFSGKPPVLEQGKGVRRSGDSM